MTAYNKIGFLAAVAGNPTGIGDYVKALDKAGIPAICMCNDGTVGIMDALELIKAGSKVPHVLAHRVVNPDNKKGVEHYSVPDYTLEPSKAARQHWSMIKPEFPPELVAVKEHVWFFPVNEVRAKRNEGDPQYKDMNAWDWMGEFCYELAQISRKEGFKVALPQANSGEPAKGEWKQPGMRKYLELCAEYPDFCAVGLHEYSKNVNHMKESSDHMIGRFQWLFAECDEMKINRPNVLIGEWGWEKGNVPGRQKAIEHIHFAASLYAKYPTVLGAGMWYLGEYQDNIDDKTQKLIKPVTDYTLSDAAKFPDPDPDPRYEKGAGEAGKAGQAGAKTKKRTKKEKRIKKKSVSVIPESMNGIKLGHFNLHGDSDYRVDQRIWFNYHFVNLLGHEIGYGSMGMGIYKWSGSKWKLHNYKQSFGGPNATLRAEGVAGGPKKEKDNWKIDQEGTFALFPYVSFDKMATKKEDPATINEVYPMGPPIYIKIESGKIGGPIDKPKAPLFPDKIEEVVEWVEVEVEDDDSDDEEDVGKKTGGDQEVIQTTLPGSLQTTPMTPSETGVVNRQIVEWSPGSQVNAVRIVMQRRHGTEWLTHTMLTESLDANSRVEIVFLQGISDLPSVTGARSATGLALPPGFTAAPDDEDTGEDEREIVEAGDINDLDEVPLLAPNTVLLDVEFVSQSGNSLRKDCGPACIAMLAETSIERALEQSGQEKNKNLHISHIIQGLRANNIAAESKQALRVDIVREFVKQNNPVILLINYSKLPKKVRKISTSDFDHFVIAAGADDDGIYFHDPLGNGTPGGYFTYVTDAELDNALSIMHPPNNPCQGILVNKKYDRLLSGELTSGYVYAKRFKQKGGIAIMTERSTNMRWEPIESKETILATGLPRNKILLVLEGQEVNGYLPIRTVVSNIRPRGDLDSFLSDINPGDVKVTSKKKIDMAKYFLPPKDQDAGDIAILKNSWGKGDERQQLQIEETDEGLISYVTKNQLFEKRIIGKKTINLILDTSPGDNEMYKVKGQWLPRHWAAGENFNRTEVVTYFNKENGQPITDKPPYTMTSALHFKKHYPEWTSPGDVKLEDVVEIQWIINSKVDETYWFARNLGLVAWKKYDNRESYIVKRIKRHDEDDNKRETVPAV